MQPQCFAPLLTTPQFVWKGDLNQPISLGLDLSAMNFATETLLLQPQEQDIICSFPESKFRTCVFRLSFEQQLIKPAAMLSAVHGSSAGTNGTYFYPVWLSVLISTPLATQGFVSLPRLLLFVFPEPPFSLTDVSAVYFCSGSIGWWQIKVSSNFHLFFMKKCGFFPRRLASI